VWAAFGASPGIANEIFNVADDAPATKGRDCRVAGAQMHLPEPRFTGEPAVGRRAITPDRLIANGKLKRLLGWRPVYPSYREGYAAILSA